MDYSGSPGSEEIVRQCCGSIKSLVVWRCSLVVYGEDYTEMSYLSHQWNVRVFCFG